MATKAHKTNWDFRSREIAAQHLSHPPATTTTSPCADDANHNRRCVKCNEDHRELMFLISSDLKLDDWCFTCRFDHRIQSLIDEAGDHPSGERDGWIIDMTEKGRGILREFALSQMRRWRADNVEKHGLQLTDEEQASMERAITGNDVVAPNDPSHFYQYFPIREADPDGEIVDPERNTPEVKRQIPFLASRPQLPKGTKLCCRDCKCRRSFQWYSTDKPPSSNKCVYCRFKKTLRRSKARYKPKGPNASLKRCLLKSLESSLDSWRRWVGKHKHGFIKDTTNEKIRNLLKGYIESHLLSTPASAQGQGDSTGTQTTGGARERKQEGRHASEDATTAPSAANTTRDGDDYEDDIFDDDTFVGRRAETARKRTASTSLTASSHLAKAPRGNITRPSTPSTRDSSIEILEELSTAPCHKF